MERKSNLSDDGKAERSSSPPRILLNGRLVCSNHFYEDAARSYSYSAFAPEADFCSVPPIITSENPFCSRIETDSNIPNAIASHHVLPGFAACYSKSPEEVVPKEDNKTLKALPVSHQDTECKDSNEHSPEADFHAASAAITPESTLPSTCMFGKNDVSPNRIESLQVLSDFVIHPSIYPEGMVSGKPAIYDSNFFNISPKYQTFYSGSIDTYLYDDCMRFYSGKLKALPLGYDFTSCPLQTSPLITVNSTNDSTFSKSYLTTGYHNPNFTASPPVCFCGDNVDPYKQTYCTCRYPVPRYDISNEVLPVHYILSFSYEKLTPSIKKTEKISSDEYAESHLFPTSMSPAVHKGQRLYYPNVSVSREEYKKQLEAIKAQDRERLLSERRLKDINCSSKDSTNHYEPSKELDNSSSTRYIKAPVKYIFSRNDTDNENPFSNKPPENLTNDAFFESSKPMQSVCTENISYEDHTSINCDGADDKLTGKGTENGINKCKYCIHLPNNEKARFNYTNSLHTRNEDHEDYQNFHSTLVQSGNSLGNEEGKFCNRYNGSSGAISKNTTKDNSGAVRRNRERFE